MSSSPPKPSLTERFGLSRPELRAWAMYDWANSGFVTTIMVAVFPVYYASTAAKGLAPSDITYKFSLATTIALTITALTAPVLGAVADYAAMKKRLLLIFQVIGVVATAAMVFIYTGDWMLALVLFVVANIGVAGAFTFYDSLLPHIAAPDELDRVSSAGYALGYLGGGLLLAINMLWIAKPQWFGMADAGVAARMSFLSVAVWWAVFSIPLFRQVPEPKAKAGPDRPRGLRLIGVGFRQLGGTLKELSRFKHALLLLVAFLIYNDGINTIIRMATVYGSEIGIPDKHMILAVLMIQFVGGPFAFFFGRLAGWIGAKRAVFLALAVYTCISILGYYMRTTWQFYLLGFMVGTVQGGSQALSRSLFASMIPRQKSSEFFAFWGVFEKFAGIIGPAAFAFAISRTGSSQVAILSVILFFAVGAILLTFVDVGTGQRVAREAEREGLHA
jgi:UMF1 family MFS transporter